MKQTRYGVYAKRNSREKYTDWGEYKTVQDVDKQVRIIRSRNWMAKVVNKTTKEIIIDDDVM